MTGSEGILSSVDTELKTITGFATSVYRSLTVALSRQKHPSISIEPITNVPNRDAVGRLIWAFTFQVTLIVRADDPDSTADATTEQIFSKVMALQGNYIDLLPVNIDWEFQNGDKPLGSVAMQFKCLYQTAENSLVSL